MQQQRYSRFDKHGPSKNMYVETEEEVNELEQSFDLFAMESHLNKKPFKNTMLESVEEEKMQFDHLEQR